MTLLVVTQKVDRLDSNLGFFHTWLEKLAAKTDLIVIANAVGDYQLPVNVRVYSLGKENGIGKLGRFFRYQRLLIRLLPKTGGVFFHMCPEYVLAAGFLPRFFGIKSLLWYTHKRVGWRLKTAEKLVDGIFTASKESCRLDSKKIEVVGHGIDTGLFNKRPAGVSGLRFLSIGRISPAKDLKTLILAIFELKGKIKERVVFDIIGEPLLPEDQKYFKEIKDLVKERGLEETINFLGAKAYSELPEVYRSHDIFLHASRTGSVDKVVLEALATGLCVFTSSEAYQDFLPAVNVFKPGDYMDLASKVESARLRGKILYNAIGRRLVEERANFNDLIDKIINYFNL